LQKLYTELVARGQTSLGEALKVGAAIEAIDILDLQAKQAQTVNADILRVFASLERGSDSHLRAFANTRAAQTGETYAPQYLNAEAYRAIVSGSATPGGGPAQPGNGAGQGGGYQRGRP
jgi:hypothetical protein